MSRGSLFPSTGASAADAAISFNAGKCLISEEPNGLFLITPEKRRGTIALVKRDGLLHFQWKDRSSGNAEVDRIVFPNEGVYKKAKTGRLSDRVYLFQIDDLRYFFWMQDKDESADEENCKKLNEYMNNPNAIPAPAAANNSSQNEALMRLLGIPPGAMPQRNAVAPAPLVTASAIAAYTGENAQASSQGAAAPFGNLDLSSILGQLNGGGATLPPPPSQSTTGAPPIPASSSSAPSLTVADLQRAMMNVSAPRQSASVPLQNVVTGEAIVNSGILEDAEVRRRLIDHLPPGQQSEEFLEENIRSPQFRQAVGSLNDALESNFTSVMTNIGIDPAPGHSELVRGDTTGAFLTSIQSAAPPAVVMMETSAEEQEEEQQPTLNPPANDNP